MKPLANFINQSKHPAKGGKDGTNKRKMTQVRAKRAKPKVGMG